jgi:hypothetical protein
VTKNQRQSNAILRKLAAMIVITIGRIDAAGAFAASQKAKSGKMPGMEIGRKARQRV